MTSPKINRLSKNIIYNILASIITFGINFALLPFIVSHIGKEIFGIFTLVMVITGYLALFDLGLTSAIIKYVAEYIGKNDYELVNDVISASFSFLLIIGVTAAAFLIVASFWFDLIFKVAPENRNMVTELLWISGIASILIWPGKSFEAALHGFQCYGWLAVTSICSSILVGVSAYVIFKNGYSIVHYMTAYYIITILRYLISYIIVYYKLIRNRIKILYYPKGMLKKLIGFGSYLFFGSLINIVILQFDNILIGAFLSVSAVTIYAVIYNMQNIFRIMNSLMGGPLFPYYAEIDGQGRDEEQRVFLLRGTKIMTFVFVSMVIITIGFAGPIIKNWMGEGFEESILPAQIFISFWIVNGPLSIGAGMLAGKGYLKIPFYIGLLNAICNLGLSLILIKKYGIIGVVLGTTIPMVLVNFPLLTYQINKIIGTSVKEFCDIVFKKNIILFIFSGLLSYLIQRIIYPGNLLITIIEMAVIYLVTLLTGYYFVLSSREKQDILSMIAAFFRKNETYELVNK